MPKRKIETVVLVCGLLVAASGCRKRTVQAAPVVIVTLPEQSQPLANSPESKPEPESTGPAATAPKKPVNGTAPAQETPELAAPKSAPQISPQLSPEEQARDQSKTNENIAAAERNLQQAYGRPLTATQQDLVQKIRSFLSQAREATHNSDWVRARTLAQKAYLLSVELVKSL